ncbi:spermine/spermidine synthase domain-containing protein [Marinobacter sp. MBR-105]
MNHLRVHLSSWAPSFPDLHKLQFFFAGFAALAYQIVSFKLISISGLGDAISVAISLTAFVALSGVGALIGSRIEPGQTGLWESLLGIYGIVLFGAVSALGIDTIVATSGALSATTKLSIFLAVVSPIAIVSGMLIPMHQTRTSLMSGERSDFSSFLPVYIVFHVGGAASLLFIEQYGFPILGWPLVGCILGSLSLMNGLSAVGVSGETYCSDLRQSEIRQQAVKRLVWWLLGLSIATGYFGIITYKAFDYLVGPNIRNYTVVTAMVFVGLSLAAIIARSFRFQFREIIAVTGLGIALLFIAGPVTPIIAEWVVVLGWPVWLIHALVGLLFIVPIYALIGISIPSAVRLGVPSALALFVVSVGNALGYWINILTASFNVDAIALALMVGVSVLATSWRLAWIVAPVGLVAVMTTLGAFYPALHHQILHHRLIHDAQFQLYPGSDKTDLEFKVVKSWNTYGWATEHVRINLWANAPDDRQLIDSRDYLVIGGFQSLQMADKAHTVFAESMAAALPAFFTSGHSTALVLGAGTGVSARLIAEHFADTDLVDISPDTGDHLYYFEPLNDKVAGMVDLHQQDALSFVAEQAHQGKQYDIIFSTVTGAGYQFSAMLYTREFFEAAKSVLRPDGVFAFWMDNRFGADYGAPGILSAMQATFPHVQRVSVFPGIMSQDELPYQVVIGSANPLHENEVRSLPILGYMNDKRLGLVDPDLRQPLVTVSDTLAERRVWNDNFPGGAEPGQMTTLRFAYDYAFIYQAWADWATMLAEGQGH